MRNHVVNGGLALASFALSCLLGSCGTVQSITEYGFSSTGYEPHPDAPEGHVPCDLQQTADRIDGVLNAGIDQSSNNFVSTEDIMVRLGYTRGTPPEFEPVTETIWGEPSFWFFDESLGTSEESITRHEEDVQALRQIAVSDNALIIKETEASYGAVNVVDGKPVARNVATIEIMAFCEDNAAQK